PKFKVTRRLALVTNRVVEVSYFPTFPGLHIAICINNEKTYFRINTISFHGATHRGSM
ncbi:hypothetical protein GIB67_006466, partial [Kingdonia uniflora]